MSNLTIQPQWHTAINQVEPHEPITGGADGNANLATKQLADNVFYLKQKLDDKRPTDGFSEQLQETGFCKLPNGLIIQWGFLAYSQMRDIAKSNVEKVGDAVFAKPFSNRCFSVQAISKAKDESLYSDLFAQVVAVYNDKAVLKLNTIQNGISSVGSEGGIDGIYWHAIGY